MGHKSRHFTSSICFLAKDYSIEVKNKQNEEGHYRVVHCILNCEKMFQKKVDRNMSYYNLVKEDMGENACQKEFRKQLVSIVKIESLHNFIK